MHHIGGMMGLLKLDAEAGEKPLHNISPKFCFVPLMIKLYLA
jgi:hypothetical protein